MAEERPSPPEGITISLHHPTHRVDESSLRELLERALRQEQCSVGFLSVVLADHDTVRVLNRTYLGHDHDTDVLAFPLEDDTATISGEIYVDLDTAHERHAEFNASFQEEVLRYALHGLLHLMGYRDKTPEEKARMRTLENEYLDRVR